MKSSLTFFHVASLCLILALGGCGGSSGMNPNQAFQTIQNAVSSAMDGTGSSLNKLSTHAYTGLASDPKCDEHGSPLDDVGDPISEADPAFAAQFFYCLVNQPTAGPDTLLGAMDQARWLTCILGDQLIYDGEPHSATITLDDTCLTDAMLLDIGGDKLITATVTTSPIDPDSTWSYTIHIDFEDPESGDPATLDLMFKIGNGVTAMSSKANVSGHENDGFSVYVNTTGGVVHYESKHQRYGEGSDCDCSGFNRHNRVLLEGNINPDGTFTALTNVEAIASNVAEMTLPDDASDDFGSIMTIKGNPDDGFYTHRTTFNGDLDAMVDLDVTNAPTTPYCTDTCTDNTGIPIETAADLEFFMIPGSLTLQTTTDWFDDLEPLSFTHVTTAQTQ